MYITQKYQISDILKVYLINLQLVSLTLDGVTGAVQERMRAEYQSKPAHMMYYVNLWSCFILSTGMYYKS